MSELVKNIEAILFSRGDRVKINNLAEMLSVSVGEVDTALYDLEKNLESTGLRLMRLDDSVTLTTAPECSEVLRSAVFKDVNADIGKAGMEVLTIILYTSPINRNQIDYIRGVNSSSSLRSLILKGMIEKRKATFGQGYEYLPSFDMLSFLGVSKLEDIDDYDKLRAKFLSVLSSEEVN